MQLVAGGITLQTQGASTGAGNANFAAASASSKPKSPIKNAHSRTSYSCGRCQDQIIIGTTPTELWKHKCFASAANTPTLELRITKTKLATFTVSILNMKVCKV